jgi:hypothetical protein
MGGFSTVMSPIVTELSDTVPIDLMVRRVQLTMS